MILDSNLVFCEGLALSEATESKETNTLDLKAGGDALGNELVLVCLCTEKGEGGEKLSVDLETDDNSGFSGKKVIYSSGEIAAKEVVAGAKLFAARVPRGLKRYLRASVKAPSFSAGKVDIFLVAGDKHSWEDVL